MPKLRASIGAAIIGVGLMAAACGSSTGHVSTGNSGSSGGSGNQTTQTTQTQSSTSSTTSQGSGWG